MKRRSQTDSWKANPAIDRIAWTRESWYETLALAVTALHLIWVACCLYLLGPALGMAVIGGGWLVALCISTWLPVLLQRWAPREMDEPDRGDVGGNP